MKLQCPGGLRARLILLVVLAVLPALGIILHSAMKQARQRDAEVRDEALALTETVAKRLNQYVESARQVLLALTVLNEVREGDANACTRLLASLHPEYPQYDNFGVVETNGLLFASGLPFETPVNLSDRPWFRQAMATGRFSAGEYQIGKVTKRATVNFAYPLKDAAGNPLRVLFVAFDLDWLNRQLTDIPLPEGAVLTVLDHDGTVLTRSDEPEKWVGKDLPDAPLVGALLRASEGMTEFKGLDGVRRLYAFSTVGGAAQMFHVTVGVPRQVALAPMFADLRRNLIWLTLVAAIALSVAWWLGSALVVQPVHTLLNAAKRLASGDLKARAPLGGGDTELARLGYAFNEMATAIESRDTAVRRSNRAYRVLSDCNQMLIRVAHEQEVLDSVCRILVETGGCRFVWIGRAEEDDGRTVRPLAQAGFEDGYLAAIKITWADDENGRGPVGTAIRSGASVVCRNIPDDARFAPWREQANQRGYASCVALPISVEERTWGALTVYAGESAAFDEDEMKLLEELAGDVGYAVTNLRRMHAQRRADEALRQASQREHLHVQQTPLAAIEWDLDFKVIEWNPAAERIFGFTEREATGRHASLVVPEKTRGLVDGVWQALLHRKGGERSTNENVTKDGRTILCEWYNTPLVDPDGTVIGVASLVQDITELRRAEEQVRRAKEEWERTFDTMPDLVAILSNDHKVMRCNTAFASALGMRPADLIGKTCYEHVHGTTEPPAFCPHHLLVLDGEEHKAEAELHLRHREGAFEITVTPLRDAEGHLLGSVHVAHDITDRKKADADLRRSEERFRNLTTDLPALVCEFLPDSTLTFVNKAYCEYFGMSAESLLGRKFLDFLPASERDSVKAIYSSLTPEQPHRVYTHEVLIGSETRWQEWRDRALFDAQGKAVSYQAIGMDITERKRAEAALRASHERFDRLVNDLNDVVWTASRDGGTILDINESFQRVFGIGAEAFRANPGLWLDMVHPDDRAIGEASSRKLLADGTATAEYRIVRPDGEVRWLLDRKSVIRDEQGQAVQIGGIARDITERKRAETELLNLNATLEQRVAERTAELEQARAAADAANHAKSEFLANMSHELRTPLNAVIGFAEALEERYFGELNEKQDSYVRNIQEGGRHLLALINDVLDLSKVEAGRMDLELGPVRIGELLGNSQIMVKEKCMKHHISFNLNVAADLADKVITADARKLKQVMYNLLSNSTKFTPDGGSITIEARLISDQSSVTSDQLPEKAETASPLITDHRSLITSSPWIEISVTDTGIGVPSDLVERVFDPFYQVKGGSLDKTPGTGLGLPLCRRLVALHGGEIWMTSGGEHNGCQVTFRIPLEAGVSMVGFQKGKPCRESWIGGKTDTDIVGRAINFCSRRSGVFSVCGVHLMHAPGESQGRIRALAETILRSYDILSVSEDGEACFVLLETNREGAEAACSRLREALQAAQAHTEVFFSIATYPEDGSDAESLLRKAAQWKE